MHSTIKSQAFIPSHRVNGRPTQSQRILTKVLWLEPLWLMLFAAPILLPGILPQQFQPLVVLALLLFWPLRWWIHWTTGQQLFGSSALILLIGWLPVNVSIAVATDAAWQALGYLLLGITLYVMVINQPWLRARPIYFGRLLLIFGMGLLFLSPLVQWKSTFRLFYIPVYDWFQQIPINLDETIHANIFAGALLQLAMLSIALALPPIQKKLKVLTDGDDRLHSLRIKRHRWERIQQWFAGLLALSLTALLILTQSRGAYLGMAIALLILALIRWPRLRWLLPLLVVVTAFTVYRFGLYSIFDLLGADNTFGGAEWRIGVWHAAGQALHDFPYSGIGIGNFRTVLPLLYPHPALESESAHHAHNLIMQIGLDLGLPGLAAYLLFMATAGWMAVQTLRARTFRSEMQPRIAGETSRDWHRRLIRQSRRHNGNWALTAGALAALVGVQIHGLLDAVTWGTKFAFLPWLLCALIGLATTTCSGEDSQSN